MVRTSTRERRAARTPPTATIAGRTGHPTLRQTLHELALAAVVTFAYFLTRGLIYGRIGDAQDNAQAIIALEHMLHLDPEATAQSFALHHPLLMQAANLFYLGGHLPVLLSVAIWLFWWHPPAYRWLRNAFLISAAIGLSVYVVFPVAPPRFMPGFVDTLKLSGINLDGSAVGLFYNPDAAMPSLHVGWAALAGVALLMCARPRWLRAAGAALPLLMVVAVLITGNHYLLDTIAGFTVAGISLAISTWWLARDQRTQSAAFVASVVASEHPRVSSLSSSSHPLGPARVRAAVARRARHTGARIAQQTLAQQTIAQQWSEHVTVPVPAAAPPPRSL